MHGGRVLGAKGRCSPEPGLRFAGPLSDTRHVAVTMFISDPIMGRLGASAGVALIHCFPLPAVSGRTAERRCPKGLFAGDCADGTL